MSYSIDLRECVVGYVSGGGSKMEAHRLFSVSRPTIDRWLSAEDLTPRPAKTRQGTIDKSTLEMHVRTHPDALLRERAQEFGVTPSGMWRALRALGMRKKNDQIFAER